MGQHSARLPLVVPDTYLYLVDYEGVEILGADVHRAKEAGWTRVSEETAVPTRIEATLYTADPLLKLAMLISVDWAGRGIVRQLTVLTDGPQTGISISLLRRIPVDTLMRYAMAQASVPAVLRPDISPHAFQVPGDPAGQAWVSGGPLAAGRGKSTSTDRIARAAEVYRDAVANGSRSPVDVVMKVMHYSSATASRDLKLARERGLLPPAGTKGGRWAGTAASAVTGTGRVSRVSAEEFNKQATELGLQGSGPKGKRLADMTPDEFETLAARLEGRATEPTERERFLEARRRDGDVVIEAPRPHDDSGPL
jgi:hypothetical protein